jgi:type II secretory pathway pseudopilin PulG
MKGLAALLQVSARRLTVAERGIGLVELLVSVVLLAIIAVMVSGLYISTTRTVSQARTLTANTREASNGMNEVARVIRAGTENPVQSQPLNDPALVAASSESVTLYAYVNLASSTQQPVKIQLSLDGSRRLVETTWASTVISPGYYGFNTTPISNRIMAGTVAPRVSGQPYLFTYVKANGAELEGGSGLSEADRRLIASIKVTLTLQGSSTDSRSAVTLQNTVGMPNLGLARTTP